MKRIVLTGVAVSLVQSSIALCEDYETYIDLPAGTQIDFVVERNRTRIRNGTAEGAAFTVTSRYRMAVEPTSSGYRVQIALGGIGTSPEVPAEVMQQLRQAAAPLSAMTVDTSEDLNPVKISDWDGFLARLGSALGGFLLPSEEHERAQAVAATVSLFRQMGPEAATQSLLREWAMTAAAQNVALNLNEPVEEATAVRMLQGAAPIRAVYRIELTHLDSGSGIARIRLRDELDPESAAAAVRVMIQQLAASLPQDKRPSEKELDALRLERTTDCEYEMDLASGLANKTRCTSTITSPEADGSLASQVDRWVITQTLRDAGG